MDRTFVNKEVKLPRHNFYRSKESISHINEIINLNNSLEKENRKESFHLKYTQASITKSFLMRVQLQTNSVKKRFKMTPYTKNNDAASNILKHPVKH